VKRGKEKSKTEVGKVRVELKTIGIAPVMRNPQATRSTPFA